MDAARIDAYAARVAETKQALENSGWRKLREDEWVNDSGDRVRFSYAHLEYRIYVWRRGTKSEWHALFIRDEPHHIPTVDQIIHDILELDGCGK